MNTELRKNAKKEMIFEKMSFFKLMNNASFWKTMENIRNNRYIKPITAEARRNCLVSEPNYHTPKIFQAIF